MVPLVPLEVLRGVLQYHLTNFHVLGLCTCTNMYKASVSSLVFALSQVLPPGQCWHVFEG